MILIGKSMCHQNFNLSKLSPQPGSELLPKSEAVGVLRIMWAIGVSKVMFASDCKAFWRNLSSSLIVSFTKNVIL